MNSKYFKNFAKHYWWPKDSSYLMIFGEIALKITMNCIFCIYCSIKFIKFVTTNNFAIKRFAGNEAKMYEHCTAGNLLKSICMYVHIFKEHFIYVTNVYNVYRYVYIYNVYNHLLIHPTANSFLMWINTKFLKKVFSFHVS